jgi:hypothetical protein
MDDEISGLGPDERDQYVAAWRGYKLRRNIAFGASFVWLLLILCCAFTRCEALPGSVSMLAIVGIASGMPGLALQLWKCPRCGKNFSGGLNGLRWHQPWVRKCYWCELRKSDLATLASEP